MYQFGCLSKILQLLKLPDGTVKVLVEGEKRVKITKYSESDSYLTSEVEVIDDINVNKDLDQFSQGLIKKFEKLQILTKKDLNETTNNQKFKGSRSNCKQYIRKFKHTVLKNKSYWK